MIDTSRARAHAVRTLLLATALTSACDSMANTPGEALNEYGNPATVPTRPTEGEITVADLQARLYGFAHDSMQGRMRGRPGNRMGTDYIAHELERLGLEPGGDDGSYFQHLPFVERKFNQSSTLSIDGTALTWQ